MKLTVSLAYTQRAADAIQDNRALRIAIGRTQSNVWEYYGGGVSDMLIAEEAESTLAAAGIPEDEFTIEF